MDVKEFSKLLNSDKVRINYKLLLSDQDEFDAVASQIKVVKLDDDNYSATFPRSIFPDVRIKKYLIYQFRDKRLIKWLENN